MKFTEEFLEELADNMNELYSKCSDIMYSINNYIRKREKELLKQEVITRWQLDSVHIKNPYDHEYISLFGDDSDFYFNGETVTVCGKTPNFDDHCLEDSYFDIPVSWLELEDDKLTNVITEYAEGLIQKRLIDLEKYRESSRKSEIEKAKEVIKNLSKEELI